MEKRLSYSLVLAGLLACVLLIGCGEDPDRVVSPSESGFLDNTGFATGLDQPVVGDDDSAVSVEDDYVTDDYYDNNTLVIDEPEDDDPIDNEDPQSEDLGSV